MICRDVWALHLSLLPNPPPAEPYLYALDQAGQTQPVEDAERERGTQDAGPDPLEEREEEEEAKDPDDDGPADEDNASGASGSGSGSSEEDEEELDPELEKLLRENSEAPSSSEGEDDAGALSARRGAGDRARKISTSTLDSDAAPLDASTIEELSAARHAEALAREEDERREKEERRRKRKERKELKRAAMARALELQANGEQDFEGFQVRLRCGAAPRAFHLIS